MTVNGHDPRGDGEPETVEPPARRSSSWTGVVALLIVCATVVALCYVAEPASGW